MATNTYTALATVAASGSTGTISFTSIPATYTDLIIVLNGALSTGNNTRMRFNNDTGSNYSMTVLAGDGSSASSYRDSSQTSFSYPGYYDTAMGMNVIQVMNYSNTTTYKTFIQRNSKASNQAQAAVGLWRSTFAINQIDIYSASGATWTTATTATIYGIASTQAFAKATGGTLYEDSTYWYHVFGASGTFTPKQSLTADILIVAGGGGSQELGGGGGAGGLLTFTSQSLTATAYTCTVGAGGAGGYNANGTVGGTGGNSQFGSLTTSIGGGGGGRYDISGGSGGSGGGGGRGSTSGGAGTSGQGYAGGNGLSGFNTSAAGGGGAGAVGANATNPNGGAGGIGATSSLINAIGVATGLGETVSNTTYFAGGGGGGNQNVVNTPAGGLGGGGKGGQGGSVSFIAAANGLPYTGGGGGGGNGGNAVGGNGGSGVVIIRYPK
jgi:hypothetical protein